MAWMEIVSGLLVGAARIATEWGGADGAAFSRSVRELLSGAGFPTFRKAAREIGEEARERLPRRRGSVSP